MITKIFDKIKSIFSFKHMPCIIYMAIIVWFHTAYACSADDQFLIGNVLKPTVWQELTSVVHNFTSWSSRVLVNLPIHILLHFDYKVWLVIEFGMFIVIFKSLSYIFITNNKLRNEYILILLLMLYPFTYAKVAGWVTTTMTYIWPVAMGCLSATTIRSVYNEKSFKWYHYALFAITTLYAANQEQMSVLLTVMFVTACVVMHTENKLSPMIVMQAGFSVFNLFFHMLTPGNAVRSATEAADRFPDYGTLSVVDKLELGFTSSLYEFYYYVIYLMPFIVLFVAMLMLVKTKKLIYRAIGLVPMLSWMYFGNVGNISIQNLMHSSGTIDESNYYKLEAYVPMLEIFFMCIFLIVSLYIIFGNTKKSVYAIALLFAGLGARMVVAFSPTVWASSNRTFTVTYFAYIGLAAMLANELEFKKYGKLRYVVYLGMVAVAAYFMRMVLMGMSLI